MFNKFVELEEGPLRQEIEEVAGKLKFPLKKIFVVDASKRSDHSNAYYFGFWNNKRIVIFDTLIKQHENQKEIVAVVSHELGHWYHNHSIQMIAVSILNMTVLFYTYSLILNNMTLLKSYGFTEPSNYISLMIFLQIYELLAFII